MKSRYGFVANSSSSSFLIYGTYIEREEVVSLLEKSEHPYVKEQIEKWGLEDGYEILDGMPGLFVSGGDTDYDGGIYIGLSWDDVKDDETGAQFKDRVKNLIKLYLGEMDCSTMSEAWYNG